MQQNMLKLALTLPLAALLASCGGGGQNSAQAPQFAATSSKSSALVPAADYNDELQRIYVAFFGRPADPAGLAYWAQTYSNAGLPANLGELSRAYAGNASVRALVDVLGTSQESRDLYPGDNDAFVSAIYRNILSREPDAAGKAYWVDTLNRGLMTRAIAAVTIMAGALGDDVTIINKKVAAAASFGLALDTPARLKSYDGNQANVSVRAMLAQVKLDTDLAAFNATILATINALGNGGAVQTQYHLVEYSPANGYRQKVGVIPASGGAVVPVFGGDIVEFNAWLMSATVSNGNYSNVSMHSVMAWKDGRLFFQGLRSGAAGGVPNSVQVSTLQRSETCSPMEALMISSTQDFVDPLRGWNFYSKAGSDGRCGSADDVFIGVRNDTPATTAPLAISLPVASIRAGDGSVAGFLVREGSSIKRVDSNFANPVTMFTLPGADMALSGDFDALPNQLVFTSGGAVYAWDTSATAAGSPVLVATLGSGEKLGARQAIDTQDLFIVLDNNAGSARVLRYNTASKTASAVGTATGLGGIGMRAFLTPSRVLLQSFDTKRIVSLPRAGGVQQSVYEPGSNVRQNEILVSGEKVWLEIASTSLDLISVNADGSDLVRRTNATIGDCLVKSVITSLGDNVCDAILVADNGSLRSLDAATGVLRVVYGSVNQSNRFSLTSLSAWGGTTVVKEYISSATTPSSAVNYLIRTDQPGLTRITTP